MSSRRYVLRTIATPWYGLTKLNHPAISAKPTSGDYLAAPSRHRLIRVRWVGIALWALALLNLSSSSIEGQTWAPDSQVPVPAPPSSETWNSTTDRSIDIHFSGANSELRIEFDANQCQMWRQGAYEIYHLRGAVRLEQGATTYTANEGIVWIDGSNSKEGTALLVYLEGNVVIDLPSQPAAALNRQDWTSQLPATSRIVDQQWFGRLRTHSTVQLRCVAQEIAADHSPPIFQRGMERRQSELQDVQPVHYLEPTAPQDFSDPTLQNTAPLSAAPMISPLTGNIQNAPQTQFPATVTPNQSTLPIAPRPVVQGSQATTRVQILPRSSTTGYNFKTIPGATPNDQILVYTGGVRVNIDSDELASMTRNALGQTSSNRLVILADNVVAWQTSVVQMDGTMGTKYEIYLEGNVVFAMGESVIYAERMFYDVSTKRGTILHADMLTPIPEYQGLVRLKADVIQQLNENVWRAHGAAVTSSRLGVPSYWMQTNQVDLQRQSQPKIDAQTGYPLVDSMTGQPEMGDNYFLESRNNFVYAGGVPIFYWPFMRTDLNNPSYYLERIRLGNDSVFGFQAGVGLDLFQLFGIRNPPAGTRWLGLVDYLQERGIGVGTEFEYHAPSFLGYGKEVNGFTRAWFIKDKGLDNIGRDRRAVPLEEDFRGRVLSRHRHYFQNDDRLTAELGWLSDQNFLQQYYEREWDQEKDFTTGLLYERKWQNQSLSVLADLRLNDFFTQTEWLPRFDHFVVGQPLLFGRALWSSHSSAGYARFRTADAPTNAVDLAKFDPLAWEGVDREGLVAGTRHELEFPFQVAAARIVPYVLGDISYWQEDLAGGDLVRGYGQAGLRGSLPMYHIDPTVQNTLFNLNGLAHKVTFDAEFLYADASKSLDELPLYNPLDDDAQEFFRRRFAFDTFGIVPGLNTPLAFDERYFAHRFGMQSYVTSPATEIADDLMMVRTGMRNRWQTKRGIPGEARVIDWITFDIQASWFPKADRDNFGADAGLVDYEFAWHVGNRLSIVSDGYFDFFSQGLRTVSLGAHMSRPGIGNLYLGFRSMEGPISSNVLNAAVSYRMSDKWILQGGSSIDLGTTGNIGQSLSVTRVGESFLVRVGMNIDASRGNTGFSFGFEPRFLPKGRLGHVGGMPIPPAGANYLE